MQGKAKHPAGGAHTQKASSMVQRQCAGKTSKEGSPAPASSKQQGGAAKWAAAAGAERQPAGLCFSKYYRKFRESVFRTTLLGLRQEDLA